MLRFPGLEYFTPVIEKLYDSFGGLLIVMQGVLDSVNVSTRTAVNAGTATDDFGALITTPFVGRRVDVQLFDNGIFFQRTPTKDSNMDNPFELQAPGYYSFFVKTAQFQVRNAVAGQNARYSIVVWN